MSNEDAWWFPSSCLSPVFFQLLSDVLPELLSSHSPLSEAAINIKIEGISYRISQSEVVSELCR